MDSPPFSAGWSHLTETTEKQLIRTDTVYSPSSATKTILAYINTLAENHGGSNTAVQVLPGQVSQFYKILGRYAVIKQEVDTNLSSPNI